MYVLKRHDLAKRTVGVGRRRFTFGARKSRGALRERVCLGGRRRVEGDRRRRRRRRPWRAGAEDGGRRRRRRCNVETTRGGGAKDEGERIKKKEQNTIIKKKKTVRLALAGNPYAPPDPPVPSDTHRRRIQGASRHGSTSE